MVDEPGTEVAIEAAFANADAMTGAYEMHVPALAIRVAPHGSSLAAGDSGGLYTVSATVDAAKQSAGADVNVSDAIVDFLF